MQLETVITTVVAEVSQGTASVVINDGQNSASTWGVGAATDNWERDSVATKQHGLGNEINDAVFGLVSPRRGLSPNSPPKVKERTITQTQIHQASSLFAVKMMFQNLDVARSHRKEWKHEVSQNQQFSTEVFMIVTFLQIQIDL